ncbi:MAG: FG-GAP-like repeat-containing protein [Acidobacteria bacterium]|nr:FG-GAP-like repeat-containing protein [Acidobacteriota bacterium]MCA1610128.1 FG-GAP-like repeat-containing protein [Acidobacteriota bacterium]
MTVLFLAPSLSAQTVTRGPYLQLQTAGSSVVSWRTDVATDSRVRYGTVSSALTSSASDSAATTDHRVTLSGLSAATRYYYSVGTSAGSLAGGDATHYLVTAPSPGSSKPVRIWVTGDSGTADANARAVRDSYLAFAAGRATDVWLMLGDNAYVNGTDAEYQAAVFDVFPGILRNTFLWPALGNHDGYSASSATQTGPYYDIFTLPAAGQAGGVASGTEAYYSFDYANIHFVCLDSYGSPRGAADPMLTWLAADLAANTSAWKVAFWHHPPYSKGSHDSDVEGELVEMRQYALPILEAGGVDLVLTGHSHAYERSFLLDGHYGVSTTLVASMKKDGGSGRESVTGAYRKRAGVHPHEGTVYAVAGTSGRIAGGTLDHPAMYFSAAQLGSLVLDVDGGRLDARFLTSTGALADDFTILRFQPLKSDFDSDGRADILWRNAATGQNTVWLVGAQGGVTTAGLPPVADGNWRIGAAGDFDGDRKTDIVWRNVATGENVIWRMNGTSVIAQVALPPVFDLNWQIRGAADFDGDGKLDILWRNTASGADVIWRMTGTSVAAAIGIPSVPDLNWEIGAAADFDGDGKPDILWRNGATGQNTIWRMNGTSVAGLVALPSVSDLAWQIAGAGDFTGDGQTDILWRHGSTGADTVWQMSGTAPTRALALPAVSNPGWRIAGPR